MKYKNPKISETNIQIPKTVKYRKRYRSAGEVFRNNVTVLPMVKVTQNHYILPIIEYFQ